MSWHRSTHFTAMRLGESTCSLMNIHTMFTMRGTFKTRGNVTANTQNIELDARGGQTTLHAGCRVQRTDIGFCKSCFFAPVASHHSLCKTCERGMLHALTEDTRHYSCNSNAPKLSECLYLKLMYSLIPPVQHLCPLPRFAATGSKQGLQAASVDHIAQLCTFVANAGPALRSVTHLTITLPHSIGCDIDTAAHESAAIMATTALLLPLATACPQLQHLTVSGRVGSRLLRHFGTSCPHLSCLDAKLTNLSPTTLQALGSLLPKLSSLTAVPRPPLTAGVIV